MKISFVSSSLALFACASLVAAQPPIIPTIPAVFPDATQLYVVNDSFIQQPPIQEAIAYVKKVVNPALLNLQPSTYVLFGNVTYPAAQEVAACHWGNGPTCIRSTDTADYKADIVTCPKAQDWGITYDDGPNGATPGSADVRNALKAANIKATFFVLGEAAKLYPNLLKPAYDEGHQIAIHGWTHRPFTSMTTEQIVAELKFTEAIIYQQIQQVPAFFRPPYGDIDDRVRAIVHALGYRTVIWTTENGFVRDTEDTTELVQKNQAGAVANITKWFTDPQNANRGFISLEHDQNPNTVALSVAVINAFAASKSQLKAQPVASCLGLPFYKTAAANATSTKGTTTTPTGAPGQASTPTPTGGAGMNAASLVMTVLAIAVAIISAAF